MIQKTLPLELAANTLKDAVFLLDLKGNILWTNQALATLVGRPAESLVNIALTDILTPRSSETFEAVLRSRPQDNSPALIELDIFRPDLSSCRLEVSLSALADPPALVAIGRDVSERRLLDEQQRRADFQTLQFQAALLELARTESDCLQDFLIHVTALAAATVDVARASIWVYNDTHTQMHCAHLFDRERNLCERGAVLEVQYAPRYFGALQEQRTIVASDIQMDGLTSELADYLTVRGIRSVLAVSIRGEGKPIGMLALTATGEPRHWKMDEQNFCASLADLTALALETDRRRRAEADLR
ncbi:MAG TPA: GAF domain-containing protein, partial [Terriglobia bacterium]|nr:GAF domain-containing protein [Terriglobia bacterium]